MYMHVFVYVFLDMVVQGCKKSPILMESFLRDLQ
jgi:hypothetical protein